ncbi:MAG: DUF3034 family protein [Caulobacter sp.]|jgi:hypothetical protein
MRWIIATALAAGCLASTPALAQDDLRIGGKLLLTGGVTTVEGSGGGGMATWATTTGYGDDEGVGANISGTVIGLPDFEFRSVGVAVGLFDRVELSYARQSFDTGDTGAKLGLGQGFTFNQDVVGVKVVVAGDAVYDQDRWLPQIAVGAQYKRNNRGAIIGAVGGQDDEGVDYYVAFTKVMLDQSLVVNGTVRLTKANQIGLLGFGGVGEDDYAPQFEGSVAWLANRRLAFGMEYRSKPDNLAFAEEDDWMDVFVVYAFNKNLSVTAAYVDLGDIATFKDQRGFYISLQAGF